MGRLVDQELLTAKLQELERYLKNLKKYQGISSNVLENDLDQLWIIQRGLQLCIQLVLDIGNHILAEAGISVREYAEIFPELARLKVISEEFARSAKGMAGLRNLLVHEYSELDMDKLVEVLNNRLDDFRRFSVFVAKYMEQSAKDEF